MAQYQKTITPNLPPPQPGAGNDMPLPPPPPNKKMGYDELLQITNEERKTSNIDDLFK
jgi:hypothetical protein